MKILRTVGALFAAAALAFAPVTAANAAPGGPDKPTDVVITKIVMKDTKDFPKKHDGSQIPNLKDYFGTDSEVLPGVTFNYYSVTSEQYTTMSGNPAAYDTKAEVETYLKATAAGTAVTDTNGQVRFDNLANGYYWFIEDLTVDGSPLVNSAVAVPFGISLPMVKADGSFFGTGTDALYVYPKNTEGDEPTVDKDVTEVGNDSDSANVGEKVTWIILPGLPSDVKTYKELTFTDVIDSRLDYLGKVVVTNGDGGAGLVLDTDYTVTYTAGTPQNATGTLVVDFTEAGIAKLVPGLKITFDTAINATAVVGTPIPNNVTVDYTNSQGVKGKPKDVPKEDQPEVWTGGEKFKKVAEGDGSALKGAVFAVYNDFKDKDDTQVVWTQAMITMNKTGIDAGKFATEANGAYTATSATNVPAVGSPVYVRAGDDGTFEILGLQGHEPTSSGTPTVDDKVNTISHSGRYVLVEKFAPEGWALRTQVYPFTVTKTSYENVAQPVNPENVTNKKITIPPTGGIGTVVFTVAGLALMGAAVVGMRKRGMAKA